MSATHRVCPRFRPSRRSAGFSLIELLVGMTIGLVSVVAITQVLALSEAQKRTTMSGSDAQVNAALSLATLQRDIRMAGYGLTSASFAAGCPIHGLFNGGPLLGPAADWVLAPVRIMQGAAGAPDSIRVMRSNSREVAVPFITDKEHLAADTEFKMRNSVTGFIAAGDVLIAIPVDINEPDPTKAPTSWCTLFNANPAPVDKSLTYAVAASAPWNRPPLTPNFPGTIPSTSVIVNTGRFVNDLYSIQGNELQRVSYVSSTNMLATAETLFTQVVNLQAVYGMSTSPNKNLIDKWTVTEPANPAEWQQVTAVRLAVVARSALREKDEVTPAAPYWMPDGKTKEDIALTSDGDWKHYRYRVYETTVPLRNVLWQSKLD